MSWSSGCLIVLGLLFVMFGGCTALVWGGEFLATFPGELDWLTTALLVIGLAILAGGIAMIAAAWRATARRRRQRRDAAQNQ
jgi:uncharacterized membrane protein